MVPSINPNFKYMTDLNKIYRCQVCTNVVEVLRRGDCELVCCNQDMLALEENAVDADREKHVPVIERTAAGFRVRIGSTPHPMTVEHHIEWIELLADGMVHRRYLQVGDEPAAEFSAAGGKVAARAFCNLHGLWGAEL